MSSSSLGKWVDQVFDEIFFQPDDELAIKAFEENVSSDFQARINGKSLTRETFKHLVVDARAKDHFSVLTIRELLADNGDGDVGVDGCVSHISTFASKDKETGAPKGESTSLTVISAAWKDGKRIMIDLTEVVG